MKNPPTRAEGIFLLLKNFFNLQFHFRKIFRYRLVYVEHVQCFVFLRDYVSESRGTSPRRLRIFFSKLRC